MADANRRKDEFLAMLGHELRNPLAPVLNALRLLERQGRDNPADRADRGHDRPADAAASSGWWTTCWTWPASPAARSSFAASGSELAVLVAQAVEGVRPLIESRKHELSVSLPAGSRSGWTPTRPAWSKSWPTC